MIFKEHGNKELPTVILLHGGGLSYWSLSGVIDLLAEKYHVITPIIDGHSGSGNEFTSIEDSARKLIEYIENYHNGKVFAVGGLSIGAQITAEALSLREEIAKFAILESALVIPIKGTKTLTVPMVKLSYGLIKYKWFSAMQAKTLFIKPEDFNQYYDDSLKISKQSLTNIILSNGTYSLKSGIEKTKAKVLIITGEKEIGLIKKSAKLLNEKIPASEIFIAKKMGHGELSMTRPNEYAEIVMNFINKTG